MNEFDRYFLSIKKKVYKILYKKLTKYPMLDSEKMKRFLLTWTRHHLSRMKKKNLKLAFFEAIITLETTCNLAKQKLAESKL